MGVGAWAQPPTPAPVCDIHVCVCSCHGNEHRHVIRSPYCSTHIQGEKIPHCCCVDNRRGGVEDWGREPSELTHPIFSTTTPHQTNETHVWHMTQQYMTGRKNLRSSSIAHTQRFFTFVVMTIVNGGIETHHIANCCDYVIAPTHFQQASMLFEYLSETQFPREFLINKTQFQFVKQKLLIGSIFFQSYVGHYWFASSSYIWHIDIIIVLVLAIAHLETRDVMNWVIQFHLEGTWFKSH